MLISGQKILFHDRSDTSGIATDKVVCVEAVALSFHAWKENGGIFLGDDSWLVLKISAMPTTGIQGGAQFVNNGVRLTGSILKITIYCGFTFRHRFDRLGAMHGIAAIEQNYNAPAFQRPLQEIAWTVQ